MQNTSSRPIFSILFAVSFAHLLNDLIQGVWKWLHRCKVLLSSLYKHACCINVCDKVIVSADKSGDDSEKHKSEPVEKQGGSDVDGVSFKGKVKEGSDADKHTVKSEPDNKGEGKKRIDSGQAKNLGPALEDENVSLTLSPEEVELSPRPLANT